MSCSGWIRGIVCAVLLCVVPVRTVVCGEMPGYALVLRAADAGDDTAVLDAVLKLAGQTPELGPDLVTLVIRLAPWLAVPAVGAALLHVPVDMQPRLSAAVLVAALAASEGQHASDLLDAVIAVAPHADVHVLRRMAVRLGGPDAGPWVSSYALGDITMDQPDDYRAMTHGLAALRRITFVMRLASLDNLSDGVMDAPDPSRLLIQDADGDSWPAGGRTAPSRSYEIFDFLYAPVLLPRPYVPSLLLPSPS